MPRNMIENSAGISMTIWIELDPRSRRNAVLAMRRRQDARRVVMVAISAPLALPDLPGLGGDVALDHGHDDADERDGRDGPQDVLDGDRPAPGVALKLAGPVTEAEAEGVNCCCEVLHGGCPLSVSPCQAGGRVMFCAGCWIHAVVRSCLPSREAA